MGICLSNTVGFSVTSISMALTAISQTAVVDEFSFLQLEKNGDLVKKRLDGFLILWAVMYIDIIVVITRIYVG